MRISTNNYYDSGSARLSELTATLMKTQQQISSGLRILTPSDDPVAATKVLALQQAQSQNTQLTTNRSNAKDPLQSSDQILTSVSDLMLDVQDLVTSASTATTSDADRQIMAQQVSSRLDQLISLANSTDSSGNPMFSGFKVGEPAFTKTATGAVYNGDQGQRMVQVDSSRQIATSDSGDKLFQSGGNDVFATLTNIVNLLNTPTTTAASKTAVTDGLTAASKSLTASHETILNARAAVGTRLAEIDTLDSAASTRDVYLQQSITQLQGLDYTTAVTDLTQQKTMLDAAQQSYVKIAGMSLFDYLK